MKLGEVFDASDFEEEPSTTGFAQGDLVSADEFEEAPDPEEPSAVAEFGKRAVSGVVSTLPEGLGKAGEVLGEVTGSDTLTGAGEAVREFGEENRKRFPSLNPNAELQQLAQDDPYSPSGAAGQAGEMMGVSMGPALAGAAAGAAVGSVVPGAGTVAGAAIGFTGGLFASLPAFFGLGYKESYDKVKAAQLKSGADEDTAHSEAHSAGLMSGSVEAGGELVFDVMTARLGRIVPGGKIAKDKVMAAAGTVFRSPAELAKSMTKLLGVELATETAQTTAQMEIERAHGAGTGVDVESVERVIMPTVIMTLATFGMAEGVGTARRYERVQTLKNPEANPQARVAAVRDVAKDVARVDPKLAKLWLESAIPLLKSGKPIIAERDDIYFTEAEIRTAVAEKNARDAKDKVAARDAETAQATEETIVGDLDASARGAEAVDEVEQGKRDLRNQAFDENDFEPVNTMTDDEIYDARRLEEEKVARRQKLEQDAEAAQSTQDFTPVEAPPEPETAMGQAFKAAGINATVAEAEAATATSPKNDIPEPNAKQKKTGEYPKGKVRLQGLEVSIENPAGTKRNPKWPALAHTYGYIENTVGNDKDEIDVFLGPEAESSAPKVFVVDQNKKDGTFDEHKVMFGFPDAATARDGYLANYEKGWTGQGPITEMSVDEFKGWLSTKNDKRAALSAPKQNAAQREAETQRVARIAEQKTELGDIVIPQTKDRESGEIIEFPDVRLKRLEYRKGIAQLARQLVKGGGVTTTTDANDRINGRTPSENPEWFKDNNLGYTVMKVQNAVKKALAGERLGPMQSDIISWMMDAVNEELINPDTEAGTYIDQRKGDRDAARTLRKTLTEDFSNAQDLAAEAAFRARYSSDVYDKAEYDPSWTDDGRALRDLATDAQKVDKAATRAILDLNLRDIDAAKELAAIIKQGQANGQAAKKAGSTRRETTQRKRAGTIEGRREQRSRSERKQEKDRLKRASTKAARRARGQKSLDAVNASLEDAGMPRLDSIEAEYDVSVSRESQGETAADIADPITKKSRQVADRAVESLRRHGGTVLANAISKDFVDKSHTSLLGAKVTNSQELATLAQVYRHPGFETARLFYIKDGVVVHQTGASSRLPGTTGVVPDGVNLYQSINRTMNALDADGYYMFHNHPSTKPTPSTEDLLTTVKVSGKAPGFLGHVIVDHNEYGTIDIVAGSVRTGVKRKRFNGTWNNQPTADNPLLGVKIGSVDGLMLIADQAESTRDNMVMIGNGPEGVSGVMDVTLKDVDLTTERGKLKATALIRRFMRATSSSQVYLVNVPRSMEPLMKTAIKTGLVDDAVYKGSGETVRAAQDMRDVKPGKFAGRAKPRTYNVEVSKETLPNQKSLPAPKKPRPSQIELELRKADGFANSDPLMVESNQPGYQTGTDPLSRLVNVANPKPKSMKEKGRDVLQSMKEGKTQALVDGFDRIKTLEKGLGIDNAEDSGYIPARMASAADSQLWVALVKGPLTWAGNRVSFLKGRKGLVDILQPVKEQMPLWKAYMVARRSNRLLAEGREQLVDQDMANAGLALEQKYPVFKKVADEWAEFNNSMLDFAEKAGVIDPASRKLWNDADYIPFYRLAEDGVVGPAGAGPGLQGTSAIQRLKGSDRALNDVFENMVRNTSFLIQQSVQNHAMLKIVDNFKDAGFVYKAKPGFEPVLVPTSEIAKAIEDPTSPLYQIKVAMEAFGVDTSAIDSSAWQGMQRMWSMTKPAGNDVVSMRRDGKAEYWHVPDPLLLRSLTAVNPMQLGKWMEVFRLPKRFLTAMVTADPTFMLANWMRDSGQAFVVSRDAQQPILDGLRGLKQALVNKDEEYWEITAAGGLFRSGHISAADPAATARVVHREMLRSGFTPAGAVRKAVSAYLDAGSDVENANRLGVALAAKRAGKTTLEAAYEARDFLDFSMRGDAPIMMFLAESVPFFNARAQGLYRLGRGMREDPRAFAMKGFLLTAASMALWAVNKDDEEYQSLEEYDKDLYWHFWIKGQHLRLPKPFEVGMLFGTAPERLLDTMYNRSDEVGKVLLQRLAWNAAQTFNLLHLPQALSPLVEQAANKNFFTQRPIVGMGEERLLPEGQFNQYTSETAISVGQKLGWSPLRIDHLVRAYTGTIGTYVLGATDVMMKQIGDFPESPTRRIDEIPLIKRFVRDSPVKGTRYRQEFYDIFKEIDRVANTVKRFRDQGDVDEAQQLLKENATDLRYVKMLRSRSRKLGRIGKKIRLTYLSRQMTPEQKRTTIDALTAEKNAIYRDVVDKVKAGRAKP